MSIRARISLAVGAVILATLLLFSLVVVRSVRATLIEQVDSQILDVSKRSGDMSGGPPGKPWNGSKTGDSRANPCQDGDPGCAGATPSASPVAAESQQGGPQPESTPSVAMSSGPFRQDVARFVYNADGTQIVNEPSGYKDDPDPPPVLPFIPSAQMDAIVGKIVTLPCADGGSGFRVLVKRLDNGNYDVTASSLKDVDAAVNDIVRLLILGGTIAVVAASLVSGWLIRRGLRPVDQMVTTATAIAGGDLSQRVPDPDPRTELGQLGGALNQMLAQVEQSMQVRTESEGRMRRFVADAAHELRTPLTSLRGYAELYRQGALPTPDAVGHAMGRIESEGSRMARLVEDLLLLARLDQHRALERTPVDLSGLVTDAVSDFRVANPDRIVSASVRPHLVVTGDALRIRQVVDNLLANAQAHTPITASVNVIVDRVGDRARLTVSDTGPGISEADQEKIFERFWRADPGRTRRSGGSGLGLSITASLVAAMDGTIDVTSDLGRGATFTVTFPIRTPADDIPPDAAEDAPVSPEE
ncbi:MAG: HAMP domain-containing sensor histidine kinase [Thermomicrobiales bacterium]